LYFSVDHPNRVSVRMEYLMQTTKARVNDREFMNTLYQRLVAEENKDLAGQTRVREWMEKDRVKNLVVNGKMDPPPDMKELEHHPVYRYQYSNNMNIHVLLVKYMLLNRFTRINKLTKRMMEWSSHFHSQGAPLPEITPVEPYEFDGDQFFRHLHQNGTYWIPEEERLAEEEKMAGKIARARLRYLEKKYHNEQREKLMIQLRSAHPSDEDIVKKPYESKERFESRRRKFRIARVKSQLFKETEKQAHVFRRKRLILERQERIRKEKAEQRKRERDIIFLGDRDQERREYLNRFKDKAASKTVVHYQLDGALQESEYVLAVPKTSKSASGKSIRSFESPSNLHTSSSFDKLREAFRVDGGYSLSKFQPAVNPVFQKYIQLAEVYL